MNLTEIAVKARAGEQAKVYLTKKSSEAIKVIKAKQRDIPRRYKQTAQQALLKAHDMSSQQRANLIEAIVEELMSDPSFQKKASDIHQSGSTSAKFKSGGKSFSSKTSGGKTTIKSSHLGGLIKRKIGSVTTEN